MKRLAIITLAIGDGIRELAQLTHPRMKSYADSIGADFIVLNERKFPTDIICYEKLQIADLLVGYDRICYVDTDVLISPFAPSIFEQVPEDRVGLFEEGQILDRKQALEKAKADGWGDWICEANHYFNAGVFVFSSNHRPILSPPPVFINNFQDQTWMNCQVFKSGAKREALPLKFDHMPSIDWHERHKSYFVHYAGCGAEQAARLVAEDIRRGM